GAVGRVRRDLEGLVCPQRLAVDRRVVVDHPAGGVDRTLFPYATLFRSVAHAVGGGVGVGGEGGHPDRRADRDVLVDRVGRAVGVDRGRDGVHVDHVCSAHAGFVFGRAVGRGRGDDGGLAGPQRLAVGRL